MQSDAKIIQNLVIFFKGHIVECNYQRQQIARRDHSTIDKIK